MTQFEGSGKYSESTRERILCASAELFARKGFTSTSIREITESASVNVAAVNYHFGGKENLYREVVRQRAQARRTLYSKIIDEATSGAIGPEEVLLRGVTALVNYNIHSIVDVRESETDLQLFYREISSPGLGFEIVLQELVIPTRKILANMIKAAYPRIGEEEAGFCVTTLFGQLTHYARARKLISMQYGREYDPEMIESICNHIVAFTMGGIKAIGAKANG